MRFAIAVVTILAIVFVAGLSFGAPPENADPALAPWFQSLVAPDGALCCSISDCRPVAYRINGGSYEALLGPQFPGFDGEPRWITVPDRALLIKFDNPTGRAILCWTPMQGPICFVRPAET